VAIASRSAKIDGDRPVKGRIYRLLESTSRIAVVTTPTTLGSRRAGLLTEEFLGSSEIFREIPEKRSWES
jgi:hypothetical protein